MKRFFKTNPRKIKIRPDPKGKKNKGRILLKLNMVENFYY